jgi:Tfp pilus assembly protein PilF
MQLAVKMRGYAYENKGDHDRAIADYSEAIRLDPKDGLAYSARGDAFSAEADFDHAIADYGEAIRINPKFKGAFIGRGVALGNKGDADRAIADFNEALQLDPRSAYAYSNRAEAYNEKGDHESAIADCNAAILLDPKHAPAYNIRADAYRAKGNFDRAIADYSEAIGLDPLRTDAFIGRGRTYEKMAEIDKARADYRVVLAIPQKDKSGKSDQDEARGRLAALSDAPAAPAAAPATMVAIAPAAPVVVNDHRIALVIGNSAYENVPALPNPARDATLIADTLKRTGFESVTVLTNLRKDALITALRDFAARAESADWAVVYYAGHGMEVGGVNYLIPTDAKIAADRDIGFEAVPLEQVLNAAERAKKLRLVILDACRDNPFASQMRRTLNVASRSVTRGLAAVEPEAGTLVVYAAKDGETAIDGDGSNSPFALAFVKNLQTPGLEVRRLFDTVRDDVMDATSRKQQPFSYGSISGRQDFYFVANK